MTEYPSPTSSATIKAHASSLASPVSTTKSCSNRAMGSKGAQRKLIPPSNAAENRNPNVNHGSCKRKVSKPSTTDQSNPSSDSADQYLVGHGASADFNLISPPRKHVCSSRRCASKNSDYAVPATVIPKRFLASKGAVLPSPEVTQTCKCCLSLSTEPCSMCSHESQLRRWSSDDRDCRALAEGGLSTPILLPLEHGRDGFNGSQSSQAHAFTQDSHNTVLPIPASEVAHLECSTEIPNPKNSSDSYFRCQKVFPDSTDAAGWMSSDERHLDQEPEGGSSSHMPAAVAEETTISPSPEKTGNWRLHAVLQSFGSLSPTREGRVKTLVRAFESLLSVTDKSKGEQQAGTKARSYPLQFSYLKANSSDDADGERQEDGGEDWKEQDTACFLEEVEQGEWDERGVSRQITHDSEDGPHQQYRWTDGGVADDVDGDETLRPSSWLQVFPVVTKDAVEDNLGETAGNSTMHANWAEQVIDLSAAAQQLEREQHSQDPVEEKQIAQEDEADGPKLQTSDRPTSSDSMLQRIPTSNRKKPHYQKPRPDEARVEEKQNAQEDEAVGHKLQTSDRPASSNNLLQCTGGALHRKEPHHQKPRAPDLHRHSTQRFSVDGHFARTAARPRVSCNKSRKPSLGGSNCMISSSRPPLAQKVQMQPAQEKLRPVKPQPFKLLTEERGHMKEQEFMMRLKKLVEEEERLRLPLAQGLPWTTDEPEVPRKPPAKENTRTLDVQLYSDLRAMERAEFDRFIAEKLLQIEERRQHEECLHRIAEEEEVRRMRQEMIPKAQLMPYFDRPFRPRRSSKRPTIPKEPQFQLNKQQPKRQKCVSSSIC